MCNTALFPHVEDKWCFVEEEVRVVPYWIVLFEDVVDFACVSYYLTNLL